jgi:hypothetical protein
MINRLIGNYIMTENNSFKMELLKLGNENLAASGCPPPPP